MDARGFARQLQKFMDVDVKGRTLTKYKSIVRDLGTSIVRDTPVDTGQARANWRFTTTKISGAYLASRRDPSGAAAIGRLASVVASLTLSKPVYMTNNAPYIQRLENGWSKQAPAGMLAKNVYRVALKYRVL